MEHALASPSPEAVERPEEELQILFSNNAYGILWHMAEEVAAAAKGDRPCADPPAVTRDIISIELDADKGPIIEPPAPKMSAAAAPPTTAAVAQATVAASATSGLGAAAIAAAEAPVMPRLQTIRAPIPLRNRPSAHAAPNQQSNNEDHRAASQSPAMLAGGEAREDEEGDVDSESSLFLWHLWHHASMYGLTPQPVETSQRPMMSGKVMARRRVDGNDGREANVGQEVWGTGSDAKPATGEIEEFPVCTFVLTTPHGDKKVPRRDADETVDGSPNRTLDVLLFIIAAAQPASCRSWGGPSAASAYQSAESGVDGWTMREREGNESHRPDPREVAEHAKLLAERTMRLAMVHRRRDSTWFLFKNALEIASIQMARDATVPPPPLLQTPQTPAGARGGMEADYPLRAPSPASSYTGIDPVGGVYRVGYPRYGIGENALRISELDLRHLLELSLVTSFVDADPSLSGLLDPKHGVDWAGWFQHLIDSPLMCTLVFEDGDTVLADAYPTASAGATTACTGGARSLHAEGVIPVAGDAPMCRSRRRMLVAVPATVGPGYGRDAVDAGRGRFENRGGDMAGSAAGGKEGEGPWVGSAGRRISLSSGITSPRASAESISMVFCVTLDKVGFNDWLRANVRPPARFVRARRELSMGGLYGILRVAFLLPTPRALPHAHGNSPCFPICAKSPCAAIRAR